MVINNNPRIENEADIEIKWHAYSKEEVIKELETHSSSGLTSADAKNRLEKHGPNQLAEKARPTFFQLVIDQLKNFIVILLLAAALLSIFMGEWVEAVAIMLIVVLNAILGVIQESRAEEALAALRKLSGPEAQVVRDGSRVTVPASELVPGDLVLIEAGSFIPADLRLVESVNLRIDEAALTGESVPVVKNANIILEDDIQIGDRKNTAFMGTTVTYGRGQGVVVSTGMHTQLGLIAGMLQTVEEGNTPLQERLDQLGKTLGYGALAICGIVFLVGFIRSGFDPRAVADLFMIAVSLAIAAVPEGLPAVVTISLALGMREMVNRHALIRRLASVETLGSATVICSDKTGTLTQNEMTVTGLWNDGSFFNVTGSGYAPKGEFYLNDQIVNMDEYPGAKTTLWLAVLNNDALLERTEDQDGMGYRMVGDPTEGCLLVAAAKAGIFPEEMNGNFPRKNEIPFDSQRKRMVTIHALSTPIQGNLKLEQHWDQAHEYVIAVKGAPDIVLGLCSHYQDTKGGIRQLDEDARNSILAANDRMTHQALRVLGFAYRMVEVIPSEFENEDLERDLVFSGLIGMIDPAREEVKPALQKARQAGIRTIMITGDYPNTARAIAENIGLLRKGHRVLTGNELMEITDSELKGLVMETDVFARVSPEHKVRIVDALRQNNQVVAMTGDGVNDAPAIKRSDIGVAMGITGTDVAKETADMVLTDDNYASIVAAVEQGRIIYNNIRKFVFFLLSSNVAEVMIIFLATLAGLPTPLTAIQLLWLNLLTDGAPALALAMEKGDPDVMERPPRPKEENIINGPMRLGIGIQTITQTFAVLAAFVLGLQWHLQAVEIPGGVNPLLNLLQYNWKGVDVQTAETMAFVTLSLCELFRAYTVRSERVSIFKLGVFSNKWMQYAVAVSILALMLVINVPFLQPIFNTHFLSLNEWIIVIGLALIPAISEEITKFFFRQKDKKYLAEQQ